MSNPASSSGHAGALLFEERRSDQHALPAQSGRLRWYHSGGVAVALCAKQLLHGKGV